MIALVGIGVVIASIIGGFTLAGGNVLALFHLSEILVIVGTAVGTVLISTPPGVLGGLFAKLGRVVQPSPYGEKLYLQALRLLYELFQTARKDGLVAIEAHIESPGKSAVFQRYPAVAKQHHAVVYLCDSLRLVLVGSVPPYDLEALMDSDIDVHHEDEARPVNALQKVSDALPGIGIVAAVLGIVVTMGAIAGPIEQIGEKVGAALTGTFMGVLLAYGFLGPLSTAMEHVNADESRLQQCLKAGVIAFAKGLPPIVAVEFARRAIYADHRPTFGQMEAACKGTKAKAAA